jgi:hypothetical protein
MKHCPQCEFLYEDDQNTCDMDGARLVHDGRRLAQQPGFIIDPKNAIQPSRASRWLVLVFAGIVIVLVSFVAYLASSRVFSSTAQVPAVEAAPSEVKSDSPATQSSSQVISASPTPQLNKKIAAQSQTKADAISPPAEISAREPVNEPRVAEKPKAKPGLGPRRVDETDQKKDSKIGSFLKKTGRILKRPFER